jgi:hypothetical protein
MVRRPRPPPVTCKTPRPDPKVLHRDLREVPDPYSLKLPPPYLAKLWQLNDHTSRQRLGVANRAAPPSCPHRDLTALAVDSLGALVVVVLPMLTAHDAVDSASTARTVPVRPSSAHLGSVEVVGRVFREPRYCYLSRRSAASGILGQVWAIRGREHRGRGSARSCGNIGSACCCRRRSWLRARVSARGRSGIWRTDRSA